MQEGMPVTDRAKRRNGPAWRFQQRFSPKPGRFSKLVF